jgi:hypothetical protein
LRGVFVQLILTLSFLLALWSKIVFMDLDQFPLGGPTRPTGNNINSPVRPSDAALRDLPTPPPNRYAPPSKPKKSKSWVVILLIVILLLGSGIGAGWYILHYKKKNHSHAPNKQSLSIKASTNLPSSQSSQPSPTTPAIPFTSHSSATFGMTFNYPSAWTVVDSGAAGTSVTSPVLNLIAAGGNTVQGEVQMNILNKGSLPSAFTTNSVAVMTSQKISFNTPSTAQAADTYISFVQYPATTITGGLDGIYISGNYGYQKDQVIPASNIATVDPLIYFNFYSCASSLCPTSSRQPLTIAGSSEWNNQSFSAPILLMIKSFSFD